MKRFYFVIALALAAATTWAQTKANGTMPFAKVNTYATSAQKFSANARTIAKATTLPDASQIISEQPEGTLYKAMYRECAAFNNGYRKEYDGIATDIVVSKDGKKLYIGNPMGVMTTGWIVGDIGEDGVVSFNFPQVIYHQDANEAMDIPEITYYAWNSDVDMENYKVPLAASQTVKFTWDGTTLKQQTPKECISMGDSEGKFSGYGSSNNVISVMTEKPVTPPAGIQSTTYKMAYTDYYTKTDMQKNVSVVIDGNDIYLGKFYSNYWIKGTINGSKVTFPAEQYLGYETISYANHEYFIVFDSKTYESVKSMEFDYDKAAGTLTSSQILAVNQGKKKTALIEAWMSPTLTDAHFVVAAPATPVIVTVMPYGAEGATYGAMAYQLNTKTDDGQELNSDNIYYNVYLDGKLTTFSYPTYAALTSSLTDIPFGFYDDYTQQGSGAIGYDFAVYNGMQYIYFYNSFNTVGLKAFYADSETGAKYESPTVTYDVTTGNTTTGISAATAADNGDVKNVEYYDLSGRKVSEPKNGIYMKTVEYANGKTSTIKIVK